MFFSILPNLMRKLKYDVLKGIKITLIILYNSILKIYFNICRNANDISKIYI